MHTLCKDKRTSPTSLPPSLPPSLSPSFTLSLPLISAWPPTSYLDSSPDKQACSLTVRAFRQASTTRAGVFAYPGNPRFGVQARFWLSAPGSVGLPPLCTTRQLLSAGKQSWHRRLLHGITVKRAPLRAFPP